jgi:hypothetical protein
MQVAGVRRFGDRVEMIEVGEPGPLADDEVLLEVMVAGVGRAANLWRLDADRMTAAVAHFAPGVRVVDTDAGQLTGWVRAQGRVQG